VIKVKYVFDTNVLISALLFEGSKPDAALKYALQNGEVLLSFEVIEELSEVLSRKKFRKYIAEEEIEEFIETLLDRVILIQVTDVICECRDPKDNKILELSISGNADYIISGDKDLLVLNPFRFVEIITVEQLLGKINKDS
jgi:putative PIN family toxin of toxin-antitoxin system